MSESTNDRPGPNSPEADAQPGLDEWRRRTEESKALIVRLTKRLRKRDRRIELLELALARTALMHHLWASHLERKLERSSVSGAAQQFNVEGQSVTGQINAGLGAVMAIQGAGAAMSPALVGWIAHRFGYSAAFLVLGIIAALGLFIYRFGLSFRVRPDRSSISSRS